MAWILTSGWRSYRSRPIPRVPSYRSCLPTTPRRMRNLAALLLRIFAAQIPLVWPVCGRHWQFCLARPLSSGHALSPAAFVGVGVRHVLVVFHQVRSLCQILLTHWPELKRYWAAEQRLGVVLFYIRSFLSRVATCGCGRRSQLPRVWALYLVSVQLAPPHLSRSASGHYRDHDRCQFRRGCRYVCRLQLCLQIFWCPTKLLAVRCDRNVPARISATGQRFSKYWRSPLGSLPAQRG